MLKRVAKWLLRTSGLEEYVFHSVFIERGVIDTILEFAKQAHPNEFSAYLQGKVTNKVLYVKGIVYEHYHATENQSVISANLPLLSEVVGTVHSHPSFNNLPSAVDKRGLFTKGLVNLIVCQPYTLRRIAAYDNAGQPLDFTVVERVKALK
ncbi:MAG TPA: Mov34/MPN/PAD-1 family protein [Candidatus Binatia bacterium]|nr:Mov34/MPN/PAD-1 family protein [Candidatus Binatia bacterium]